MTPRPPPKTNARTAAAAAPPPPPPADPIGPPTVALDKWEMGDRTADAVRRIHATGLAAGQAQPPK